LMRPLASLTWRSSSRSVLSDRASGAVFVACLGALLLPVRFALGAPAAGLGVDVAVFLLVLAGAAALGVVHPRLLASGPGFWEALGSILPAMASLFADARRIAAQLGFASANVLLTLCVILPLARGMAIPVDALQLLQFVPVIILVTSLPLLYLGWGGREMIMVSTVGSLPGVSANDALSLAISIGALGVLAAFPNGLFLLTGWRGKPQT
jgi:lysylphosphatidylglycerol synthase-like protein